MSWAIQSAFAGAWGYIFHWGTGIGLIVLLLVAAYFTTAIPLIGPFLNKFRWHLVVAAGGIALFLAGSTVGSRDAMNRCIAKQEIVKKRVEDVVNQIKNSPAPKDGKLPKDLWDTPEN